MPLVMTFIIHHIHDPLAKDVDEVNIKIDVKTPEHTISCQHELEIALHLREIIEAMKRGENVLTVNDAMLPELMEWLKNKNMAPVPGAMLIGEMFREQQESIKQDTDPASIDPAINVNKSKLH